MINTAERSLTLVVEQHEDAGVRRHTSYAIPYITEHNPVATRNVTGIGTILERLGFAESDFPDNWHILITVNAPIKETNSNDQD